MEIFIESVDKRSEIALAILQKKLNARKLQNLNTLHTNDILIYPPNKKMDLEQIQSLPDNINLFANIAEPNLMDALKEKNIKLHNYMNNEVWTLKNAILTSEGVLAMILNSSPKSIYENNILILGGGRIAKACAILFNRLGLKFSLAIFTQKDYDVAYLFSNNILYRNEYLSELQKFDIIINTIPNQFIDEKIAKNIDKNAFFIETASKNSIFYLDKINFTHLPAPALPTKFCAETAGKLFAETLEKIIKEMTHDKN